MVHIAQLLQLILLLYYFALQLCHLLNLFLVDLELSGCDPRIMHGLIHLGNLFRQA